MKKDPTFSFHNARGLVEEALTLDYFFENDDGIIPIPHFFRPSNRAKTPLVVVVGENASGKSFFRRIVSSVCQFRQKKIECISISMEARAGLNMLGALKGFVYGDEGIRATGENSARTVTIGIRTCRERDTPHVIVWDEPDLGLSEAGAAGLGQAIASFASDPPAATMAAVVITHSRPLVSELLAAEPHYLHLGADSAPQTLADWLARPIVPRDPEELFEAARRRFKLIGAILKEKRVS